MGNYPDTWRCFVLVYSAKPLTQIMLAFVPVFIHVVRTDPFLKFKLLLKTEA